MVPPTTSSAKTPAPFGAWFSPITTKLVLGSAISLPSLRVNAKTKDVLWTEGRPEERGRQALVVKAGGADGNLSELIPDTAFNARSRVHEYGGGEMAWLDEAKVAFSDVKGALYTVERDGEAWTAPQQVSPGQSRIAPSALASGEG